MVGKAPITGEAGFAVLQIAAGGRVVRCAIVTASFKGAPWTAAVASASVATIIEDKTDFTSTMCKLDVARSLRLLDGDSITFLARFDDLRDRPEVAKSERGFSHFKAERRIKVRRRARRQSVSVWRRAKAKHLVIRLSFERARPMRPERGLAPRPELYEAKTPHRAFSSESDAPFADTRLDSTRLPTGARNAVRMS